MGQIVPWRGQSGWFGPMIVIKGLGDRLCGARGGAGDMSTVLVVDDEERVRTFLARSMSSEGHTVVPAEHGNAALERMADGGVDLVLLDVLMPQCNGLQVLSILRQRKDATLSMKRLTRLPSTAFQVLPSILK